MKELIRNILRESINGEDSSDWNKFNNLSKEERVEYIKEYKTRIEKLIPSIVKYFKVRFKGTFQKIEIQEKRVHYSSENLSISIPVMKFYIEDQDTNYSRMKQDIHREIKDFFGIDVYRYATPLDFEVYRMRWERV